jgi:uncharacterized protein (DUF1501 family)
MFGVGAAPLWLARTAQGAEARKKVLVAIFQRGAVDGLSVVAPYGESRYYQARPNVAIAKPGSAADAAINLDGFFGLHPALSPLKPLFDDKQLVSA